VDAREPLGFAVVIVALTHDVVVQQIAQRCAQLQAQFGEGCRFVPDYRPQPLETRVAPRRKG